MAKKIDPTEIFLEKLQKEADFQKELSQQRLLPSRIDVITAFIGTHVWQVVGGLALLTAALFEVIEKL